MECVTVVVLGPQGVADSFNVGPREGAAAATIDKAIVAPPELRDDAIYASQNSTLCGRIDIS